MRSWGRRWTTCSSRGSEAGPLRPHVLQKQWAAARTTVGVSYRFHDLRHFGATLAVATGASTKELMRRLGHASPQAALIYQHATEDRDRAIAEALADLRPSATITPMGVDMARKSVASSHEREGPPD